MRITMRTQGILLSVITVIVLISSLANATLAICPSCKGTQPDWVASATDFLEGRQINNTPTGLNGPQQARLLDAQIDAKKKTYQSPSAANNTTTDNITTIISTPTVNIVLNDIRATPNPANFGDAVKIIAAFGNASSNTQIKATQDNLTATTSSTEMMVYADIKNASGIMVGRSNLKRSFGCEYSGIWKVYIASGAYNVTIEASGSQGSRIFNDALNIIVNRSKNTTNNDHAIRNLG